MAYHHLTIRVLLQKKHTQYISLLGSDTRLWVKLMSHGHPRLKPLNPGVDRLFEPEDVWYPTGLPRGEGRTTWD